MVDDEVVAGEVGDGHVQQVVGLLGDCWSLVRGVGFLWGVYDREVGVVREAHQGGEEGVGRVARVMLFDSEGQGECHKEVQEGPFRSSLEDRAAWLQEGGEARSGADCVYAGADVVGGVVAEGEAHAFLYRFQKGPGGVRERSLDVEGGDDEVHRDHVGDGVLEEMASCGDRPGIAPKRLAGMWGSS